MEKRLSILFATEHFVPLIGGISEHVYHLSHELAKLGHRITILAPHYYKRGYTDNGSRQIYVDVMRVGRAVFLPFNGSLTPVTYTPHSIRQISYILKQGEFDIVHAQGSIVPTIPFVSVYLSKYRTVSTFHATHGTSLGYKMFRNLMGKAYYKLDGRIAVSETAKNTINAHFPGREIEIIPNGIDTEQYSPQKPPLPKFKSIKKRKILFVGRLEWRKGIDIMINAFKIFCRRYSDTVLIVVGDGPLMSKARKMSRGLPVVFEGAVSQEFLPFYYRSADVFVAPSVGGESFGIVIAEAMAASVPVVVSDIEGYKRLVRAYKTGMVFKNSDAFDLAAKLEIVLNNRDYALKLAQNARQYVIENYKWSKIAKKTAAYYYKIIGQKSK